MASFSKDLAIHGGTPVRSTYLPYGRQSISAEDRQAVLESLESSWITRGPKTQAFEEAIAKRVGFAYGVAFSSATAGLHAVMNYLQIDAQQSVLVPAITFAATANAVRYQNGKVVFADVDVHSMNLLPSEVQKHSGCKVITAVDFAGRPCDYAQIRQAMSSSQSLVLDAAHSLGAEIEQPDLFRAADICIFSFHPVKSIAAGEGGMVMVQSLEAANYLRQFRNHGIKTEIRPGYSEQEFLGYNYHMTEMQAALGLSQLSRLPEFISRRKEIANFYDQELRDLDEYFERPRLGNSSWHLYPLRIHLDRFTVGRDEFLKALRAENIGAQVHYMPVYWHPYYQSLGYSRGSCPQAETQYLREISLPIFPDLQAQDLEEVLKALKKLVKAFQS